VLESIVGKEFLPRGKGKFWIIYIKGKFIIGIVTRRPIEIQLINTPGEKDWFEFLEKRGELITDPEVVKIFLKELK